MDNTPQPNPPEQDITPQITPPVYQPPDSVQPAPKRTDWIGIIGIILAFIMPIIGIVLSVISVTKSKPGSRTVGIVGIVLNVISIIIGVLIIWSMVSVAQMFTNEIEKQSAQKKENDSRHSNAQLINDFAAKQYELNKKYPTIEQVAAKYPNIAIRPSRPFNKDIQYIQCKVGIQTAYVEEKLGSYPQEGTIKYIDDTTRKQLAQNKMSAPSTSTTSTQTDAQQTSLTEPTLCEQ